VVYSRVPGALQLRRGHSAH